MTEIKFLEPGEILADVETQPPLMREEAKAAYLGQHVDWALVLADAHQVTSGQVRLLLRRRTNEMHYVATTVPLVNYPWVNSIRTGQPVLLRGQISAVDKVSIEVEASDLIGSR